MSFRKSALLFLATGFYSGKIPFAPGTFGSLAALPFCYLLSTLPIFVSLGIIGISLYFSIWIAGKAETILDRKDPGCIVIDEMVGMFLMFAGLPFTPGIIVSGFVLFRILDILKPTPIRYIEKRLNGGMAIVLDDVAAGIIGNIFIRIYLTLT